MPIGRGVAGRYRAPERRSRRHGVSCILREERGSGPEGTGSRDTPMSASDPEQHDPWASLADSLGVGPGGEEPVARPAPPPPKPEKLARPKPERPARPAAAEGATGGWDELAAELGLGPAAGRSAPAAGDRAAAEPPPQRIDAGRDDSAPAGRASLGRSTERESEDDPTGAERRGERGRPIRERLETGEPGALRGNGEQERFERRERRDRQPPAEGRPRGRAGRDDAGGDDDLPARERPAQRDAFAAGLDDDVPTSRTRRDDRGRSDRERDRREGDDSGSAFDDDRPRDRTVARAVGEDTAPGDSTDSLDEGDRRPRRRRGRRGGRGRRGRDRLDAAVEPSSRRDDDGPVRDDLDGPAMRPVEPDDLYAGDDAEVAPRGSAEDRGEDGEPERRRRRRGRRGGRGRSRTSRPEEERRDAAPATAERTARRPADDDEPLPGGYGVRPAASSERQAEAGTEGSRRGEGTGRSRRRGRRRGGEGSARSAGADAAGDGGRRGTRSRRDARGGESRAASSFSRRRRSDFSQVGSAHDEDDEGLEFLGIDETESARRETRGEDDVLVESGLSAVQDVPSWVEAIGIVIAGNLDARSRSSREDGRRGR
jgi:hypothetical protein